MLPYLLNPAMVAGVVLGVCLGSTWWLWRNASADAAQGLQADFDFRVRELVNSIAQRMQTYEQVLYGVQGLYISSDFVDRDEFHRYLDSQHLNQHFPGIQGVGYMRLVAGAQREAHVRTLRLDGFPDYTIHPEGARAQYAPIVYIEPFSGTNLKAFGFDPLSDPVRRAGLERARDSGLPALTGRIRLVQEDGGGPGAAPRRAHGLGVRAVPHRRRDGRPGRRTGSQAGRGNLRRR
jgi:CHASE1-domain containing sensor protein